jgi:pseudolysin
MLGDGGVVKYPSTAIGVIAHEIAHGFTEQHSNLVYDAQSGGLNESFSDMSDQAAQYYAYNGKNNWMHDAEITKAEGRALRYLDQPSKDCYGVKTPGVNCSIDHVSQYSDHTDVHYSSGIFNRVFYLIGTAKGWNARKTFNVMVKANTDYWTPNTTFSEAACGVINAAKDYKYNLNAVMRAFDVVGVDTGKCQTS